MHRIFALLLVLPLVACEPGQPFDGEKFLASLKAAGSNASASSLIESAQAAETKGDYQKAAAFYRQALDKDPDNKDLRLILAETYRRSGEFDKAIDTYDYLIASDTNMLVAKEGKGLALMAKGDYETPTPLFEQVMKEDPKRWKTLNALGILFATRNMYSEAQQYFNEALKYNPNNPGVMNNLGLTQALGRDYKKAVQNLTQASSLTTVGTPERKRIDLDLALVHAASGKLDAARSLADNYASSENLEKDMGVYAHLSNDEKLARNYLHLALTGDKSFYDSLRAPESYAKPAAGNVTQQADAPVAAVESEEDVVIIAPVEKPGALPATKSKSATKAKSKKSAKAKSAKKPKLSNVTVAPAPKVKATESADPLSNIVGAAD